MEIPQNLQNLYKCNIFSKIISKNALIIACNVGLSFKTNFSQNLLDNTTSSATTDPSEDCRFLENSCHFEPFRFGFVPGKHQQKQKKID